MEMCAVCAHHSALLQPYRQREPELGSPTVLAGRACVGQPNHVGRESQSWTAGTWPPGVCAWWCCFLLVLLVSLQSRSFGVGCLATTTTPSVCNDGLTNTLWSTYFCIAASVTGPFSVDSQTYIHFVPPSHVSVCVCTCVCLSLGVRCNVAGAHRALSNAQVNLYSSYMVLIAVM